MPSDLRMGVQPYGDGRVLLTLGGLSLTLAPAARDKLRELLDRAAMPGQPPAAPVVDPAEFGRLAREVRRLAAEAGDEDDDEGAEGGRE